MATYGHTFTSGDTLTPPKLNDARTVTDIVDADISSGADIAGSKLADGGVIPAKLSQPLTFRTAQATTSGTAIPFTDIPSWAKRITVMLNQVQNSGVAGGGNSAIIIQLGTSAVYKTTGYIATGTAITGSNLCGIGSFTAGFSAGTGVLSTSSRSGCIFLHTVGSNFWVASGTLTNGTIAAGISQGVVSLAGTLDSLRLTTVGGTDAFTGGSINIAYEG